MTCALVPAGVRGELAEGGLLAHVNFIDCDAVTRTARYALRVMNNTGRPACAEMFVDTAGVQRPAYPRRFQIAPHAMHDDVVAVRLDETGPYDRAIVHVYSGDTSFMLEAAAPPPRRAPRLRAAAAVCAGVAALAGWSALQMPRILAVSAPQRVMAGSTVQIPFQVSGAGTVEYDFAARDGLRLAAGLASRSGVLDLRVPAHAQGAPYTLHLRMNNALFGTERTVRIADVTVPPAPKPAPKPAVHRNPGSLIADLSVTPSPVRAGEMLTVRYATQAQRGEVWLVGTDGRTWARAPLSSAGISKLAVPQAAAGHDVRVVLHAQTASANAQSAVGVSVLPNAVAAEPGETASPAHRRTSMHAAAPAISVDSQVVSPGDSVVVRVSGVRGDVKIALMNASGTVVEQGSVSEDDGAISLTAPSVASVTTYYVVATFQSGTSEQSVLRRLVVTPR